MINKEKGFSHLHKMRSSNGKPFIKRKHNLMLSTAYVLGNTSIPAEKFNEKVKNIMSEYKYNSTDEDKKGNITPLLQLSSRESYKRGKENIKKIIFKSGFVTKSQSTLSIFNPTFSNKKKINETSIRFFIEKEKFQSPFHAYDIVQKNKIIYENMMDNFENREYDKYKQTYSDMTNFLHKINSTPRIRIIPKIPQSVNDHLGGSTMRMKSNPIIPIGKKLKTLSLHFKAIKGQKIFPESRVQFAFCKEGNEILLHGGLVTNNSSKIWKLNPLTFKWNILSLTNVSISSRFGHTGILYHRQLILFGGKNFNKSEFFDLEMLNIDTMKLLTPTQFKNIKLRRNHIACMIGNQMLIHGGIDESERYLNDAFLLNVTTMKWSPCIINTEVSPTLAFHSSCLVLQEEYCLHSKLSIYRLPDLGGKQSLMSQIRERGLYLFGGKESNTGLISKTIWILRIGRFPLEWVQLKTIGEGPSARYSTSINYYEVGNCLFIHGGRNDFLGNNYAFDDTYLLDLYTLNWVKVSYSFESQTQSMKRRCSHAAIIHDHNLIIFGGMNSEVYLGNSLAVLELNTNNKIKAKQEEKQFDNWTYNS